MNLLRMFGLAPPPAPRNRKAQRAKCAGGVCPLQACNKNSRKIKARKAQRAARRVNRKHFAQSFRGGRYV